MREQAEGLDLDDAIIVREFGEAPGRERDRMRRDLSQVRQAVARGRKSITEARALMDFADSLLAATYGGGQKTIEVLTGAHINEGRRAKEAMRPKAERYAMLLEVTSERRPISNFASPWCNRPIPAKRGWRAAQAGNTIRRHRRDARKFLLATSPGL